METASSIAKDESGNSQQSSSSSTPSKMTDMDMSNHTTRSAPITPDEQSSSIENNSSTVSEDTAASVSVSETSAATLANSVQKTTYEVVQVPPGTLGVNLVKDQRGVCIHSKSSNKTNLCVNDVIIRIGKVAIQEIEDVITALQSSMDSSRFICVKRVVGGEETCTDNGDTAKTVNTASELKLTQNVQNATASFPLQSHVEMPQGIMAPGPLSQPFVQNHVVSVASKLTSSTQNTVKSTKKTVVRKSSIAKPATKPEPKATKVTSNDMTLMIPNYTDPNLKKEQENAQKVKQIKKQNKSLPKHKKISYKEYLPKPKKAINILTLPHVALEEMPRQGYLCKQRAYYICQNNDTYKTIANKLGIKDWKILSRIDFNVQKYGVQGCVAFRSNTIIRIPTGQCSNWKMEKLIDVEMEGLDELATCSKCRKKEKEGDTDEMLLCDGCDLEMHLSCAGLSSVPTGDWLCENCLEILRARKEQLKKDPKFCVPSLPEMEELPSQIASISTRARDRKNRFIASKKEYLIRQMETNQEVLRVDLIARGDSLQTELDRAHEVAVESRQDYDRAMHEYDTAPVSEIFEKYERLRAIAQRANQNINEVKEKHELVNNAKEELRLHVNYCTEEKNGMLLDFAALQGECQLPFETKKQFKERENNRPLFLGIAMLTAADILYINLLTEPTELVLVIPTEEINYTANFEVESGKEYYLFGTPKLFSKERDDTLPINLTRTASSVRNAQRELISILSRDPRNAHMQVSKPIVPNSVSTRGKGGEDESAVRKCFDLSELVRDCNYPIENQPAVETPKALADLGLELRDYQKCSLKWMIDKEQNPTGLGSAGEIWSCLRTLDADSSTRSYYYYCNLTGSIVQNIFDYKTDVQQKSASYQFGNRPSFGILGEEMGLGKTIIALSLIVASPPPLQMRVLPREHIAKIAHPEYLAPISPLGYICPNVKKVFLSNGTLVIAPMTLCSQWQSEVEKFAPFMSVLTLHNDETQTVEEIASKDIIIASTFLLQNKGKALLLKLKRIHFHRILLDESHYNNSGDKIKNELATLAASHRYCLTGTPVGHSLQDLYGQLRFLRVPQFCRPDFWKESIETPYNEHNLDGLQVLRTLLSHVVIRHSKEQTVSNGKSLLSLPPRKMETLLIPFGSACEKKVYDYIENRNQQRFVQLRLDGPKAVLGKYIELLAMMFTARQATAHSSLVDLDKMQKLSEDLKRIEEKKKWGNLSHPPVEVHRKKNGDITRADILKEAETKAKVSARGRMREQILSIHEGAIEAIECAICLDLATEKNIAFTPCAHSFCFECILTVLPASSGSREPVGSCPTCRDNFKKSELTLLGDAKEAGQVVIVGNDFDKKLPAQDSSVDMDVNGFHLSTKDILTSVTGADDVRSCDPKLSVEQKRTQRAYCSELDTDFLDAWNESQRRVGSKIARLLEEIKEMMRKDPTNKCVVFSQFLGTLDIAGQELFSRSVPFARVDGNMQQHERADAIQNFTNDPKTKVLLLSMRAGAAGLNLMAANYCFLMDAPMNSAIEEQAIDRIHRIGQTRPVTVKRLIIQGTVEERILSNRRSIAADGPSLPTQLDGTSSLLDEEAMLKRPKKKKRIEEDENEFQGHSMQRLERLAALFGCSLNARLENA